MELDGGGSLSGHHTTVRTILYIVYVVRYVGGDLPSNDLPFRCVGCGGGGGGGRDLRHTKELVDLFLKTREAPIKRICREDPSFNDSRGRRVRFPG